MLRIIITEKNSALDLFPDTKIKIRLVSQLWNFDNFRGSFSLPIRIPTTTHNKKTLGIWDIEDAADRKFSCIIEANGIQLYEGEIKITDVHQDYYEVTISLSLYKYKDKLYMRMHEVDIYGGNKVWDWQAIINNNEDFRLPIINVLNFWSDKIDDNFSNLPYANNHHNFPNYDYKLYSDNGDNIKFFPFLIPAIKVHKLIEYIANWLEVELFDEVFSDELSELLTITHNALYYVTYHSDTDDYTVNPINNYNLKNHVPQVSFAKFLKALRNYFAVSIELNNSSIRIRKIKDILSDSSYIDWDNKLISTKKKKNDEAYDNIRLEWDYDEKDIEYFDIGIDNYNIHREFPTDAGNNDLVLIDDCGEELVKRGVRLYIKKYIPPNLDDIEVPGWLDISQEKQGNLRGLAMGQIYRTGTENEKTIHLNTAPLFAVQSQPDFLVIPGCNSGAPGNSQHTKSRELEKIRFLFERPITYNGEINYYSTHYNKDKNISLDFFSQCGIFKRYWEPVWEQLKNIKYYTEAEIKLGMYDIINIDMSKKIRIRNKLYYINNLEYDINADGSISITKAELFDAIG